MCGENRPFSNCPACLKANPGDDNLVRRNWHCGYMPREKWSASHPKPLPRFGGQEYEADACPGYVVTLESVTESARAYAWFSKGQLETAFPNPPAKVVQACEIALQAWNRFEAEQSQNAAGPTQLPG